MVELNGYADLHTHTTASDGLLKPSELVKAAKQKGLGAVAITDHDTVSGVAEALKAGAELGIEIVPGIEISTQAADNSEIHILGYYCDLNNREFLERLEKQRVLRDSRNDLIINKLQALGMDISIDEVIKEANARRIIQGTSADAKLGQTAEKAREQVVGRPHIAAVLLAKGYVSSIGEAFDRYLAAGASAYVSVKRVSPEEAIDWIAAAGGVSIVAHPGLYHKPELVEQLVSQHGVNGIEVFHSDHTEEDQVFYGEMAARYEVLVTGGSDYHGERGGKSFHGELGCSVVPIATVSQLKNRSIAQR